MSDDIVDEKVQKTKEELARQLSQIVCICKGINLGRVLKAMDGCETVADVNRKAGTGSGGCKGERCGPRIKILLNKKRVAQEKKLAQQQGTTAADKTATEEN